MHNLIIFVLLLSSSLAITGYGVYCGNHAYQIPLVHVLNDPMSYPGDPLAASLPYYCTMLWRCVALGTHFFTLENILFYGFLIERLLLLLAAGYLAMALAPKSRLAIIGAMAFLAMAPCTILGGGMLVAEYFEQTSLSIPFFLLAAASFYRSRRILWAMWFSIGFNLNSMYGAYALAYFLSVFLFDAGYRNEWKRWISPLVLAALLSSPALALTIASVGRTADDALWLAAVRIRSPFHLYPLTWDKKVFFNFGVLVLLTVTVLYWNRLRDKKLFRHGTIWTIVAVAWLAYAFIAAYVFKLPRMLLLQPARGPDLWYCFAAISVISTFALRVEEGKSSNNRLMVVALFVSVFLWSLVMHPVLWAGIILLSSGFAWKAIFHKGNPARVATIVVVSVALFASYQLYQRKLSFSSGGPREPIKEIATWAKKTTPADACFLINPTWGSGWQIFRALSRRPVFVTWKDGTAIHWDRSFVHPWSERLKALGFDILHETKPYDDLFYERLRDDDVKALNERFSIAYWVVTTDHASYLPVAFQNGEYKVLKLQ